MTRKETKQTTEERPATRVEIKAPPIPVRVLLMPVRKEKP